ncbi:MAG: hypothetical protein IPI21_09130 [Propionivibrio sp.]|jgi:hypothetical protein|nr:hypothetical protein [Propionivibrio sp.]
MTNMEQCKGSASRGDVVRYSDISNPGSDYTVIGEVRDAWGSQHEMVCLTSGRIVTNSLRQPGWTFVRKAG